MTIPIRDQFGPWRPGLDSGELLARLRSMRAIAGLILGPRSAELSGLLKAAENDNSALAPALAALDRLAPLDRRRILASYASLARPSS